jgi:hypothetical protein
MYLSFKLDNGMSKSEYELAVDDVLYINSYFFRLGFLGTLIGFTYVINNMEVGDVAKIFAIIKTGFGTKLYTSMMGVLAHIWISTADHLNRR